jgi:DNA-binding LacI/PurR family transcriptional regulator
MSELRRRAATMADVAALANVSHQTVSRVVNHDPNVSPKTAERVAKAIEQLGYRRNSAARLLASSRSRTIGVVTWGSGQFGPSQVVLGLEQAARSTDYRLSSVSIAETSPEAVEAAFDQLMEAKPEAIIVIVTHETVLRIAHDMALDVPTLVLEGDLSRTPLTAGVDNAQGARMATRHLIDLGHTSIAHLAGPPGWNEALARIDGWRAELQEAGLEVPPLRWGGDWSAWSGYRAGLALAREKDVTAVFAANDQMALGLCAALREQGRRVPEDVSIVGFDDLPESEFFSPPLTTVRQDFSELGRRAMVLVERVLAGEQDARVDLVPTTLVVRRSTSPRTTRWPA